MSVKYIEVVGREATFEWGSDPGSTVFPGANYGNDVSWVEDADPVEI